MAQQFWEGFAVHIVCLGMGKLKSKRGITLLEFLVVVVVVIIIIATVRLSRPHGDFASAKAARTRFDLRTIAAAIEVYRTQNKAYPPTLWVLTTPVHYIEGHYFFDPFSPSEDGGSRRPYYAYMILREDTGTGAYLLAGRGPDRSFNSQLNGELVSLDELSIYDPGNGVESAGDIVLTENEFLEYVSRIDGNGN